MSITIYLKMALLFSKASVNIFVKRYLNYKNWKTFLSQWEMAD